MSNFKPGKINKHILHSNILERDVTLSVYLPEDYSELFKYQVIICFDGLDFLRFGRLQREYERLRREDEIQRAIIIDFIMKMLINVEKNSIRGVLEVIKQYKLLVKSCYHLLIRRFQLIK